MNILLILAIVVASSVGYRDEQRLDLIEKSNKEKFNKDLVTGLMQEVYGDKNIDAMDKYIDGENYIQHNPLVADGREALRTILNELIKDLPKVQLEVQRVAAEDDLVVFHWKSTQLYDGKVASIIEIFRVENQKIVEHWDVTQFLEKDSANSHPLF